MRWFVEISPLGASEAKKQKWCIEAAGWQPALKDARALRGEEGPLGGFSIELLDDGARAVDPATRIKYVLRNAPDDAPLTHTRSGPVNAVPAKAEPAKEPAKKIELARVEAAKVAPVAEQAADDDDVDIPVDTDDDPSSAETAPPPELPAFQLVHTREENPTASSPLTYREYVYAVAPDTEDSDIERLLYTRFETIRLGLAASKPGRFVNLAIFDHVFTGKPTRKPRATLTWKDWRGAPEIRFPSSEGASMAPPSLSAPTSASMALPAPSRLPPEPSQTLPAPQPSQTLPAPQPSQTLPAPQPSARAKSEPPPAVSRAPVTSGPITEMAPTEPAPTEPTREALPPPEPAKDPKPTPAQPPAKDPEPAPPPAEEPQPEPAPPPARDPEPEPAQPPAKDPEPAPPPAGDPGKPEPAKLSAKGKSKTTKSDAPPAISAAPRSSLPVSAAPKTLPAAVAPTAREAFIPPTKTKAQAGKRMAGDELIAELFEACGDLQFLRDSLEGADFVLTLALEKLPSEVGLVSLFDINRREFVVVRQAGGGRSIVLSRLPERAGLADPAMRKRSAIVVPVVAKEPRAVDDRIRALGLEAKSLMVAPVEQSGRYLGLIELWNPVDGRAFTEGDGHALTYIGEQYAEFVAERGPLFDPETVLERHQKR